MIPTGDYRSAYTSYEPFIVNLLTGYQSAGVSSRAILEEDATKVFAFNPSDNISEIMFGGVKVVYFV